MGNKASHARKGFTGVLPTSRTASAASTTSSAPESSPAIAKSVEIPGLQTPPPHALLQGHSDVVVDTPRRAGFDEDSSGFLIPESVRKSRMLDEYENICSEILPGFLYVSNLRVAQNTQQLHALGITHIVNCCKEVFCFPDDQCVFDAATGRPPQYLQLALRDGVMEDLLPFMAQVIAFIDSCQKCQGRVLIHCHQGVSRSCAFAVAYVMYQSALTSPLRSFREANAFVKSKRDISSPNTAFLCQLIEFEKALAEFAPCVKASATTEEDLPAAQHQATPKPITALYRLTRHAPYDPDTWVLKRCYHPNSRRPVETESTDTNSVPRQFLWSRGIFVYMNYQWEAVIWKGRMVDWTCSNGATTSRTSVTELAREQVAQLIHMHFGRQVASLVSIVVENEALGSVGSDGGLIRDVDQFQYADELAWAWHAQDPSTNPQQRENSQLTTKVGDASGGVDKGITSFDSANSAAPASEAITPSVCFLSPTSTLESTTSALASRSGITPCPPSIKTQSKDKETLASQSLFLLNESDLASWEQLIEYDSDDLTAGNALFLWCESSSSYVWLGRDCPIAAEDVVQVVVAVHPSTSSSDIVVEHQGSESNTFWDAFEAGY